MVMAILAVGVALVSLALPDGDARRLEEEAARLTALLDEARAEARVAGVAVRWVPLAWPGVGVDPAAAAGERAGTGAEAPMQFAFVGLPRSLKLPQRWLHAGTRAEVPGGRFLLLGPEAILPAQRVVLSLGEQRLALVSDGLSSFTVAGTDAAPPP